ncbi:MAG: ADP-ribose pyrophosphatase, partial [Oscillospiraceae bacterium]
MAHFEKTNSSKTLFEGKIITLTLDDVTLENGKTALREVVHHNGGACVAALTPQNEIYLVQQFRYPFA